ncbi:uncharacterized protein LOC131878508 isoform X2 [Tigriopus californicus]|uniref:uncharacterized protein LOC131878508 isoform X2 n=1 Tax=Tigriopus californicus TaxID=6832 RepID=UPI0027DA7907|nr:uncharacterized protein LOC131878508 isoform X2 [Tigriopus californicus]
MLLNISRDLLSVYIESDRLEYAQDFGRWVEHAFLWMPYVEGIPQFVLNSVVLLSISVILNSGRCLEKPAFVFIANLAVSDLVMCLIQIITLLLRLQLQLCESRICRLQNCQIQLSLWTFSLSIKYSLIVTKSWIVVGIAVSWLAPIGLGMTSFLIQDDHTRSETNCISTHLMPKLFVAFGISLIIIVLFSIYLLYGVILVKFYRQKKSLERAKSKSQSIRFKGFATDSQLLLTSSPSKSFPDLQNTWRNFKKKRISGEFNLIFQTLKKVCRFIHAAQYVIVLIAVFTIAWLPWLMVLYFDVFDENFKVFDRLCTNETRPLEGITSPIDLDLSNLQRNFQFVIANPQERIMMDVPNGADLPICTFIHQSLHSFMQDYRQLSAMLVGILNSILNPIIYAFWYPEFRDQCRNVSCPRYRVTFPIM